jgi:hypothetical protein
MTEMTEAEFERNCERLWCEIEDAVAIFYTAEEIQSCARGDEDILNAIQQDALFWKVQVHALQSALFIALGRIFDISGDAYSIHKLMRDTGQHFAFLFSHEALRARKAKLNLSSQDLDNYFVGLWRPDPLAVRTLRKALAPHLKRYSHVYLPLRNQYFAHTLVVDQNVVNNLFANTNRLELEETLLFAREAVALIQEMYNNGCEPKLGNLVHARYRDEIRRSASNVLGRLGQMHAQRAE